MNAARERLRASLAKGRRHKGSGALAPCRHSAMRTARLVKTAGTEASHLAARVRAGVFTLEEIRADLFIDPKLEAQLMAFADKQPGKACCDPRNYRERHPGEPTAPRCAEQIDLAVSVRGLVFRRLVAAIFELIIDRPALIGQLKRGARDEDNA